ncbi:phosphopantetheine-binding protein, partial [Streptomyces sp. NPDC059740]|uniref:phosphopantetheine-binding protein n=1 Tax=Streptomyces sp. NPDC059740 TaxID=3346926 RepID=UPI003657CF8F
QGVAAMAGAGVRTFLELAPDAVLTPMINDTLGRSQEYAIVAAQRRDQPEDVAVVTAAARLHAAGHPVDWPAVVPAGARAVDLPGYPFQHRRYWLDAPAPRGEEDAGFWAAVDDSDLSGLAADLDLDEEQRTALGEVVPALADWRRDRRSWYRTVWRSVPEPPAPVRPGTWWLVTPATGPDPKDTAALTAALADAGATVDLRTPAELEAAPQPDPLAPGSAPVGVLVFHDPAAAQEEWQRTQDTLSRVAPGVPVWWATRRAVAALRLDADVDPAQAALWGAGRAVVAAGESAGGGVVDLPAVLDADCGRLLPVVLSGATGETEVAVRPSGIYAPRLVRMAPRELAEEPWHPHGTVLVWAGATAAGARVARWLARAGASEVVVALAGQEPGRETGLPTGVEVLTCPDAPGALADALTAVVAERRPHAVIHLAHPAPDAARAARDRAALDALDRATRDAGPEVFACVGDFAAVLAAPAEPAAASVAALADAVVRERCRAGLAGVSVLWGDPGPGAAALLRRAPRSAGAPLVATGTDWAGLHTRPGRLLADVLPEGDRDRRRAAPEQTRARLLAATPEERSAMLRELVAEHAALVLGAEPEQLDGAEDFLTLGFSSMTVVELCTALGEELAVDLSPRTVMDHPTPDALAAHLAGTLGE